MPLGWLPHDWYWSDGSQRDPSAPFPLEQAWFWETDPAPAGADREELVKASVRCGSVLLGTDGSEDHWILVTAGPLRGRVWLVSEVGACPFVRPGMHAHEGEGIGFLDWLTYWSSLDGRSMLEDFEWPHPAGQT